MDERLRIFRRLLTPLRPGKLLDLGAGHGKFSMIAKELGWEVTAVDARTARMPMTPGIEWITSDVRDFRVSGYDCICILGLLYHLELEDALDLLGRCAGTTTILDTHVALRAEIEQNGYEGRIFHEERAGSRKKLANVLTASWGNPTSFWPTRESLLRMLTASGYEFVFESIPPYLPDRTFYFCL